ncbi:Putative general secretion pathway protein A [Celerinatantimonas diazotrophica]|nr:Putative general secretion pathway protein A [Celerinatantimonas diazotrophica]
MREMPFSIAPNPDFLFISPRHQEALAHLKYGLSDTGGFVLLTGEVGTGKTTLARTLLRDLDSKIAVATLLNPQLNGTELLAAVCDGFGLHYPKKAGLKILTDVLVAYLQSLHDQGGSAMLLIDEAQQLSMEALELLRLLTNLETDTQKLLRIVLVGQPELQLMLRQKALRQLSQRITARYQLLAFNVDETSDYIVYRLKVAGCDRALFSASIIRKVHQYSGGIPRLINLLCDRALLETYMAGEKQVSLALLKQSASELELLGNDKIPQKRYRGTFFGTVLVVLMLASFGIAWKLTPRAVSDQAQLDFNQTRQQNKQRWQDLISQSSQPKIAMAQLIRLWGYAVPLSQARCELLPAIHLACFKGHTSLSQLIKWDYPVQLRIQEQGMRAYALLRSVSGNSVQLYLGKHSLSVTKHWLQSHWTGEYQLIWKPDQDDADVVLKHGDSGPKVLALARQLALFYGQKIPDSSKYSKSLQQLVVRFQREQGLKADGVATIQTRLVLSHLLHSEQPNLEASK